MKQIIKPKTQKQNKQYNIKTEEDVRTSNMEGKINKKLEQ